MELVSPRGVSPAKEMASARQLHHFGIDAINIPDGPRASARMSALAMAVLIQREVGIETVLHFACRDRNVIGMQSDLLGAWALGLRNILAITGDPPKLGNYPHATAVFDVDAIGLINLINRLNHGLDLAGNPIGEPTGFSIGVGVNPGAINLDEELRRLDWKIEAGAEYMITQPVFDIGILERFMKRIEHVKIPLLCGIWPLVSYRNAEFMNNEVPGASVPPDILERMRKTTTREEGLAEGVKIAHETLQRVRRKWPASRLPPRWAASTASSRFWIRIGSRCLAAVASLMFPWVLPPEASINTSSLPGFESAPSRAAPSQQRPAEEQRGHGEVEHDSRDVHQRGDERRRGAGGVEIQAAQGERQQRPRQHAEQHHADERRRDGQAQQKNSAGRSCRTPFPRRPPGATR